MGIIGQHVKDTTGNAGSEKAAAEALATWDEAMEILGLVADEVGGDDAYRTLDVANQVKALAFNIRDRVNYTQGRPMLGAGSGATAPAPAPAAQAQASTPDTTKDSPVNTEPSEVEKLGEKLLALFGNDLMGARKTLVFLDEALAKDTRLLSMMAQVLGAISRDQYPDRIVEDGGQLVLASQRDLRKTKDELDSAFDTLITEMVGAVAAGSVKANLAEAQKELRQLRKEKTALETENTTLKAAPKGASEDTFLKMVIDSTGVEPRVNEAFADYMARVVVEINKAALGTNSSEVTKLLDEIGNKLGVERNGRKNDEYKTAVIAMLDDYIAHSKSSTKHYEALVAIAKENKVTVDSKDTATQLAIRIAKHGRLNPKSVKVPANLM